MKKLLTVATLALLFVSCSEENNESTPSLLHKWFYASTTINGLTEEQEIDGCDRDYVEFTEDLLQTIVHSKNEENECAVTSSIGKYNVSNSMIYDSTSSSAIYEIISISENQLVLHYLIPIDTDGDGDLDDVTYTFSRT